MTTKQLEKIKKNILTADEKAEIFSRIETLSGHLMEAAKNQRLPGINKNHFDILDLIKRLEKSNWSEMVVKTEQ